MRFFDSCTHRVTLADVAEDIAADMRYEKYLKKLHENREREQLAKQADANKTKKDMEKM